MNGHLSLIIYPSHGDRRSVGDQDSCVLRVTVRLQEGRFVATELGRARLERGPAGDGRCSVTRLRLTSIGRRRLCGRCLHRGSYMLSSARLMARSVPGCILGQVC